MRLKKGRLAAFIIALAAIIAGLTLNTNPAAANKVSQKPVFAVQRIPLMLPPDLPLAKLQEREDPQDTVSWSKEIVRNGDSMSLIFKRMGIPARTLHEIMNSGDAARNYKLLRAGQDIDLGFNNERQLIAVRFSPGPTQTIQTLNQNDVWQTQAINKQLEIRLAHASGIIEDSLFVSGGKAGLSDNTIMQLAGIFGWDIDFALDIRKGDQFSIIYETQYLHGEKIGDGDILAAKFTNRGKTFEAIRYSTADNTDYYSADGKSMRKAFLRTPVKFSRISSRFTNKRWHPVLNKWRSHKGVDYAAPRGTPVKATSDGKISFRGRKGGYGNVIFIDNGKTYTTVYGHLNSFAKGLRKGSRVKQGQIIGYVGSTGLATGPHLHYELRINGVHRNPLTAKLPKAQPIAKKYLLDFTTTAKPWLERLALIDSVRLASAPMTPDNGALSN